jgi:hypothetical protein
LGFLRLEYPDETINLAEFQIVARTEPLRGVFKLRLDIMFYWMVVDIHCPELLLSPGKFASHAPNFG